MGALIKKLKKRLCLTVFALSISVGTATAEEIELKFTSWASPKHYLAMATTKWIDEVNEKLAGRVKIVEYPGGQLYGTKDAHRAVSKGLVDMAQALQPRMMSMAPAFQGVYLPFFFDNLDQVAQGYKGESRKILDKVLAKKNIVMMFPLFTDGVQLFSNKQNIRTAADFKGLRVLAMNPLATKAYTRLGAATDTSIPYTEVYMALKRGVADATMTNITSGYFRKTFEVCKYITKIDVNWATLLIIVNKRKWNSFPDDVKQIMLEAGKKQTAFSIKATKGWEKKLTAATKKKGAIITKLPKLERDKIRELVRPVWTEWVEKNGEDAKKLMLLNSK